MPTTITLAELTTAATSDEVLATELSVAQQLGLPITSWNPLDPSRTLLQIQANLIGSGRFGPGLSGLIANIAMGGYASYSAVMPAVTTTYNDGAGFFTTWMDLRCVDQYNVSRIQASAAAGPIAVSNSTAVARPYSAGQLRFQHPVSGATYTNTNAGTISASGNSNVTVLADPTFVGPAGTLAVGQVPIMLTPFPGVTPLAQTIGLIGSPIETNSHYLTRCQNKLAVLSPNGSSQAYEFIAESVPSLGVTLADGTIVTGPSVEAPWVVSETVTRANTQLHTGTGFILVYVANASGGLLGSAQNPVTGVTNAVGCTVTVARGHGIQAGGTAYVLISGVVGANGVNNATAGAVAWLASYVSPTSFTLNNTVAPGAYVSGGSAEIGDLGMVDASIQAQCVPSGFLAITQAAQNVAVPVVATVYVSSKSGLTGAQVVTSIQAALGGGVMNGIPVAGYMPTVPVGGVNAEATGIVPWSEILTVIANANAGTVSVQLMVPSGDVSLLPFQVPVLGTCTISPVFV
jgi:hypothetical protein